jgi:hypothetical protein
MGNTSGALSFISNSSRKSGWAVWVDPEKDVENAGPLRFQHSEALQNLN